MSGSDGIIEVEYGEYPQTAVNKTLQDELEALNNMGALTETGKTYTTDSRKYNEYSELFQQQEHIEVEYNGKKYVRKQANLYNSPTTFSNGIEYENGDYIWFEVQPLKWLVDEENDFIIAKDIIFAGVQFANTGIYKGDLSQTDIKKYMDDYLAKDIIVSNVQNLNSNTNSNISKINPYNFIFDNVSEEEIIKGAIEANVPVFLHGEPGEGKSGRIKGIDPDCEILSLGTLTPELLVGMGLKNQDEKVVEHLPPPWYDRLVKKCHAEPDKIHILFLDELNNASPNMQKYGFSIALDRKVNDIFPLPDNVRIVAAGNETKDSTAAYEIARPLYDRFMHVNIRTTVEQWLKWASKKGIHPAIYAFITYGGERVLRTKYDEDDPKPNANPRKWEMASKVLQATKNPEMLRALVGEDLTKEFVFFCKQQVLTLQDIIDDNYDDEDLKMNYAQKSATAVALSYVDQLNLEKVWNFVSKLGPETLALFESLWIHGDKKRLEKIAELKMANLSVGGVQR